MVDWYRRNADVLTLTLHVQPGAKRSEIGGLHGEALKIRLAAPPVEGRANDALLKFIAKLFDVPLRQVELRQGGQSRHKVVAIVGSRIEPEELLKTVLPKTNLLDMPTQ
ncbi:MAG: YggU family protein [Gallionellales bacterium GWA2_55_18]|nr:MAG: YggU family protein [Gallionellales bacterium GWA2_55_18]